MRPLQLGRAPSRSTLNIASVVIAPARVRRRARGPRPLPARRPQARAAAGPGAPAADRPDPTTTAGAEHEHEAEAEAERDHEAGAGAEREHGDAGCLCSARVSQPSPLAKDSPERPRPACVSGSGDARGAERRTRTPSTPTVRMQLHCQMGPARSQVGVAEHQVPGGRPKSTRDRSEIRCGLGVVWCALPLGWPPDSERNRERPVADGASPSRVVNGWREQREGCSPACAGSTSVTEARSQSDA